MAAYLSTIVADHDLPEKVMVFHQVHASVVLDEDTEHGALMTPEQVLALTSTPDYVLYE